MSIFIRYSKGSTLFSIYRTKVHSIIAVLQNKAFLYKQNEQAVHVSAKKLVTDSDQT
jgi:hypothetical protein